MNPPPEPATPDAEKTPAPAPASPMIPAVGAAAGESAAPAAATPSRVTLRSDIRASWLDGLVALVVTAAVFVILFIRIKAETSSTLTVMPFMADTGAFWMYYLSQAFGWSALLWAWGTVIIGLLLSGPRPARLPLSGPRLERLHRTTSLNTIALIVAHALLFAAELIYQDTDAWPSRVGTAVLETFIPGGYNSGTGVWAMPIGQAALYLAIPLGLLFYVRHRIGPKTWRILHRFVLVVYVLSVWHTLLYGTNVWYDGAFRNTVWLLQLPIAALFLLRLLRPARRSERLVSPSAHRGSKAGWSVRLTGRVAAVAVIGVLVAVIASGRDGGRTVPPEDTSSTHVHDD
ncbi:ferric reductase-like transmembrane domain-containing protein [Streptomyces sp. NPDC060366]|uniref:ferric reductase-like transmembrane domain-containing protein n=1 Tax=Streptomyces sp. NPDC060366 TaxID=3347105 RepID=UPI00365DC8BF